MLRLASILATQVVFLVLLAQRATSQGPTGKLRYYSVQTSIPMRSPLLSSQVYTGFTSTTTGLEYILAIL
jgi:hypothetical protein